MRFKSGYWGWTDAEPDAFFSPHFHHSHTGIKGIPLKYKEGELKPAIFTSADEHSTSLNIPLREFSRLVIKTSHLFRSDKKKRKLYVNVRLNISMLFGGM